MVSDAMSEALVLADHDEDIDQVIDRMAQRGVRRVPIVDERGILAGILSLDDCISFMHQRLERLSQLVETGIQHEAERDTPSGSTRR